MIHQIEVVDYLVVQNIRSPEDWAWNKQLKIVEDKSSVRLNMANASFDYTF